MAAMCLQTCGDREHHTEEHEGDLSSDEEPGQEQRKKEKGRDGTTTREHPEGFESPYEGISHLRK